MNQLPRIRLVVVTDSLYESSDNLEQFARRCNAQLTPDDLKYVRPLLKQSFDFYAKVSAIEPWVGYISISLGANGKADQVIGCCGFKGNPNEQNEVEVAYHTFGRFESNGFATAMAHELFDVAKKSGDVSCVVAHTLAETNASTAVLEKNSFTFEGEMVDPDDGIVWRWTKLVETDQ